MTTIIEALQAHVREPYVGEDGRRYWLHVQEVKTRATLLGEQVVVTFTLEKTQWGTSYRYVFTEGEAVDHMGELDAFILERRALRWKD